jgi:EAL domain-containing protein (putative c-di-GMP-specific phosphodiesterase class I)/ActR/RegA family two-component response regulator
VAQHFTPQSISEQYKRVLEQSILSNVELRRAIENQEFCLYYQPIFSLSTGIIQGFEALLRWQKGPDQFLLPSDFLPRLESTGWLSDVTPWIFQEAANQLKQWQTIYPTCPQYLRINLSVSQFFDTQLMNWIEQYWLGVGLSGSSLGFDITEAVLMTDPAGAIAVLLQLRERGVKIYLDSFGSGVASLQSLHQFPLDGLALDRTLIATMGSKHNDLSLLNSLIALGETLEVPLHAEGIATAEQLHKLKSLGFQLGQGAFLAPPMEAALTSQLLTDNYQHLLNAPFQTGMAPQGNQDPREIDQAPLVLVVDDDAIMRKVLNRFLRSEGFRVIEATNAKQALESFQVQRPQIVLLDAIMPGMDGFKCCDVMNQMRLKQMSETSHCQICLLTSRDDEDSVNLAFASGADDYITKPVNWAILRQRLSKYAKGCQALVAA